MLSAVMTRTVLLFFAASGTLMVTPISPAIASTSSPCFGPVDEGDWNQCFTEFDQTPDNKLDASELIAAFNGSILRDSFPNSSEVREVMDKDADGFVSRVEWIDYYNSL